MNDPLDHSDSRHSQEGRILAAITTLCTAHEKYRLDCQDTWPSTRDIAESCDYSIYKTRYLLLKMARQGKVQVTPRSVRNSLRWYIGERKAP